MNLKKIINKKIPHNIGIFLIAFALFQVFNVIVPHAIMVPLIRKDIVTLDSIVLIELIFSSLTTLVLIFYILQYAQNTWFKRGTFLLGYITGITLGLIISFQGIDLPSFLNPLFKIFSLILNSAGAYYGMSGTFFLVALIELPILFIVLPMFMGGVFLLIRGIMRKIR
ncbi:hypothetical protein KKG71_00225 [Patescibacteria group bacterium]|nr:hypothetical protein [Patescibacteria group bacterium]